MRVYGPGVEKGVKTNQPTHFTVDCTGAGNGKFEYFFKSVISSTLYLMKILIEFFFLCFLFE